MACTFLYVELEKANKEYSCKLGSESAVAEKTLFTLGWKVDELGRLSESGRKIVVEMKVVLDTVQNHYCEYESRNVPRQLATIRARSASFLKDATRYHRVAATHIFVIMISPEDRSRKPYALPIQCLPYVGMPERTARELTNKVVKEMVARNMSVAGIILWYSNYECFTALSISKYIYRPGDQW